MTELYTKHFSQYAVPELSFTTDSITVFESAGTAEVCLLLSVPLTTALNVPLIPGNTGSATPGTLYMYA